MSDAAPERSALHRLIDRLSLESQPGDVFVGGAGRRGTTVANRLFGGLVAAQAVVAAARTVEEKPLHSLHAYFLRPGRPDRPIRYEVARTKEGRNFHARQVVARQQALSSEERDEVIFQLQASFTTPVAGVHHQAPMPAAPDPESAPSRDALRGRPEQDMPIEVRMCDPIEGGEALPPALRVWMRPRGALPEAVEGLDAALLHLALLVYASDRTLLTTAWRPHAGRGPMAGASLDHALWIHEPPRFDDWHLFAMESPVASAGRGLAFAGVYRPDGRRVATVAQEGTLG